MLALFAFLGLEFLNLHDDITLALAVLHLLLKGSADGVQRVATGDGLME